MSRFHSNIMLAFAGFLVLLGTSCVKPLPEPPTGTQSIAGTYVGDRDYRESWVNPPSLTDTTYENETRVVSMVNDSTVDIDGMNYVLDENLVWEIVESQGSYYDMNRVEFIKDSNKLIMLSILNDGGSFSRKSTFVGYKQ